MIALNAAIDAVLAAAPVLGAEEVPLLDGLGRALAVDITSPEDVPSFTNSAMDGFAVRARDIRGARAPDGAPLRIVAEVPAGSVSPVPVSSGEAVRIMTGAPIPDGADTVVPVELTEEGKEGVFVTAAVEPGANVRHAGEDLAAGGPALPAGTPLGPAEVGLLASIGVARVRVARRPRVAILATGSELVPPGAPLGPGQIRNSNSFTAYGQALAAGAEPLLLGIARDDPAETRDLIARALEEDVVLTSGGVSVGEFDFVKRVQEELGVERRFWRVRTKPGKPMAFGVRGDTLVFGAPGNPVASMVSFELYVRPALLAMQGRTDLWRPWVSARAVERVRPSGERVEARRCRLLREGDEWRFSLTGPQGSGILRSMALADGLVFVPSGFGGGEPGTPLMVLLLEGSRPERPPFPD